MALALDGFDVTDAEAVARGVEKARAAFGPIDILVNNAGAAPSAPFRKTGPALWAHVLATDLTSVYLVTQAALADIEAWPGPARIVNVASTAGLTGYAYVSAYCAAKHGVIGLTRALALELARDRRHRQRRLSRLHRYADDRKGGRQYRRQDRADASRPPWLSSPPPIRRAGLFRPAEVADCVLWLASPGASSINGQAIAVAGGEVMAG